MDRQTPLKTLRSLAVGNKKATIFGAVDVVILNLGLNNDFK